MWNNLYLWELVARFAPIGTVITGLLILVANSRVSTIKDQQKKTPPVIDAKLLHAGENRFTIYIESKTLVPFKYKWDITNQQNTLLSGVMMSPSERYPTEANRIYRFTRDIDVDKVIDGIINFSFRFESIYAPEFNYAKEFGGVIKRKYKFIGGTLEELDPNS
jgi:hypothetical protein